MKYINFYIQKRLNEKLDKDKKNYMELFENNSDVLHILTIRNIAVTIIKQYQQNLISGNIEQMEKANQWFNQ